MLPISLTALDSSDSLGAAASSLLSQLQNFNRKSLHKTEMEKEACERLKSVKGHFSMRNVTKREETVLNARKKSMKLGITLLNYSVRSQNLRKQIKNLKYHLTRLKMEKTWLQDTTIKTEDGKIIHEYRDDSGNYRSEVTNKEQYGFIPDIRLDLQVGEVKDNLLFGSQDVAAEWSILEKYRVTHIVNIGTYVKNYFPDKIQYINIKVNDFPDSKILEFFDRTFNFIDEGCQTGCVFIHCNAGVSRASAFTIGYLMKTDKMTFKNALAYVKSKRPAAKPNEGFVQQLREFERSLGLTE